MVNSTGDGQPGKTVIRVPSKDLTNNEQHSAIYKVVPPVDNPDVDFWGCVDWDWTTPNNNASGILKGYFYFLNNGADEVHGVQYGYSQPFRIWDLRPQTDCFQK